MRADFVEFVNWVENCFIFMHVLPSTMNRLLFCHSSIYQFENFHVSAVWLVFVREAVFSSLACYWYSFFLFLRVDSFFLLWLCFSSILCMALNLEIWKEEWIDAFFAFLVGLAFHFFFFWSCGVSSRIRLLRHFQSNKLRSVVFLVNTQRVVGGGVETFSVLTSVPPPPPPTKQVWAVGTGGQTAASARHPTPCPARGRPHITPLHRPTMLRPIILRDVVLVPPHPCPMTCLSILRSTWGAQTTRNNHSALSFLFSPSANNLGEFIDSGLIYCGRIFCRNRRVLRKFLWADPRRSEHFNIKLILQLLRVWYLEFWLVLLLYLLSRNPRICECGLKSLSPPLCLANFCF